MDRLNNLRFLISVLLWLSISFRVISSTGAVDSTINRKDSFGVNNIPQYHLNNATKLIHVDDANQIGFLIGDSSYNVDQKPPDSQKQPTVGGTTGLARKVEASNYSIYLVSHNDKHIAILLDLIDIDFEPQKNCDNQELRFSVVSEIKEILLNAKQQDKSLAALEALDAEGRPNEAESIAPGQVSSSTSARAEDLPPMPVSEAMSILLNSPLNKSILETGGSNDFKLIDLTIDYLHADTCEHMTMLIANKKDLNTTEPMMSPTNTSITNTTTTARPTSKPRRHPKRKSRPSNRKGQSHRNSTDSASISKRKHNCNLNDPRFTNLMSSRLDKYFTWDDFKVVCGNIRRLVIPMRSLKMSVYIDEFSASSKFRIRYQFIEDPSELPAEDNGKYFCRNRNIIDLELKCDGYDDCGDASDESVSVCGYPPIYYEASKKTSTQERDAQQEMAPSANGSHSAKVAREDRRLSHYKAELIDCCQPSDWIKQDNSQLNNLQSVIESMRLFSPPLFAPTSLSDNIDDDVDDANEPTSSGLKRRVKRIVGGGIAQKGYWPSQASLQYEIIEPQCHFCAGTLIHPQYVLTAGHCVDRDGMSSGIRVVFGAHDLGQLGKHSPGIQVRYVEEAQQYPGVNAKLLDADWNNDMNNDIALLRLNAPVVIKPHIIPACLPPFNSPPKVNTSCRSIGWGQTHGSGSSNLLKQLPLKVLPGSSCSKELIDFELPPPDKSSNSSSAVSSRASLYSSLGPGVALQEQRGTLKLSNADKEGSRFLEYDNKTMICVNNDLGHGICHGDSGGPLFCDRLTGSGDTCTEMYGVASFIVQYSTVSAMCAVENLPGIFAEVSLKREWISSTMKMFEKLNKSKYSP